MLATLPAGVVPTHEMIAILALTDAVEKLSARLRVLEAGDGGRDMTPEEVRQAVADTSGINDVMRGRSTPKDGGDA